MTNKELMIACGSASGSYDPESPDQTRWTLQNGEGEEKALAWVKMTSLHRRSPFCVNEAGQVVWLDSMAADNGWTLRTAENYAYKLNSQGRIRLKGKRIWYRADATVDSNGRINGEETDSVQSHNVRPLFAFPSYVVEHIERLPEEQREAAARKYATYMEWDRAGLANTVAAWRAISAPFEDNILREIGMEKKRLPKRRSQETGVIQLQLLEIPAFVQTNGHASVYNGENGHVQSENRERTNRASLLSSDSDSDVVNKRTIVGNRGGGSIPNRAEQTPPSPPSLKVHQPDGRQTAVAVVAAPEPETLQRFERWRTVRNQCPKPVPDENPELRRQCFEVFASYSPPEQETIIADTAARVPFWQKDKLQFIPNGLKYLRERIWKSDPVQNPVLQQATEKERKFRERVARLDAVRGTL
jgi:hypothetical protein